MSIFFLFSIPRADSKKEKKKISARKAKEKQVDEQNAVLFILLASGFCFLPPEYLQLY